MSGPEAVRVYVATRAKPNADKNSSLNREFFKSFLEVTKQVYLACFLAQSSQVTMSKFKHNNESMTIFYFQVLNLPENAGRFNISTQFPHYREIFYKPDFRNLTEILCPSYTS